MIDKCYLISLSLLISVAKIGEFYEKIELEQKKECAKQYNFKKFRKIINHKKRKKVEAFKLLF